MRGELVFKQLLDRIIGLERVVERQSMRINNMIREAKVTKVDAKTGTARVLAHGIETDPMPWLQYAGSIVDWDPLSEGQRVMLFSPNGDPAKGFLLPGGYTTDVPQPHEDGDMYSRTLGGTKVEVRPDSHLTETETYIIKGNVEIEGNVLIKGSTDFTEGHVKHDGTSIDKTHLHGGVIPGAALTDTPV